MLRRRDTWLIIAAALILALIAWALLASDKSDAPTEAPGASTGPSPDEPPAPEGRIYFSAGGSIYAVSPDGSGLAKIIQGERGADRYNPETDRRWASSPAVSPDGSTLAFVLNFDVWVSGIDGSNAHELIDGGDWVYNSCCASNFSHGANSVAWSPDGRYILATSTRIGGSGVEIATLATADGTVIKTLDRNLAPFIRAAWLDSDTFYAEPNRSALVGYSASTGAQVARPLAAASPYATLSAISAASFVTIPWEDGKDIQIADATSARTVASGVYAIPDRSRSWIAYLRGDELRVVTVSGSADHLVLELGVLGGRDRMSVESDCHPVKQPACSYRPPVLSWGP